MTTTRDPIIIIGAGWAGLAAAVYLTAAKFPVLLLEAAPQAGGRARRIYFQEKPVDNGQHLLLGAYQELLSLLKRFECAEHTHLSRHDLHLHLKTQEDSFDFRCGSTFAPFHLLSGLLRTPSLNWKERLHFIRLLPAMKQPERYAHLTVQAFLEQLNVSSKTIAQLWAPLCLAALSTPYETASASVFLTILGATFLAPKSHSQSLIPKVDLSTLFVDQALHFIQNNGGTLRTCTRVDAIVEAQGRCVGVKINDEVIPTSHVIIATHPFATEKLLPQTSAWDPLRAKFAALQYEPITTVYLQYPKDVQLPLPMMGFINEPVQWVFDRGHLNQPGLLACVVTGQDPVFQLSKPEVADVFHHILKKHFYVPPYETFLIVKEKRAALHCSPEIQAIRPKATTPLPNCWLAGDYVHKAFPSTLEGALLSGKQCATLIMRSE